MHTGRGTQYSSRDFPDACRRAGVAQSIGAVGSSADNAAAESWNAAFKRETLQGRRGWPSEREARLDTFRWLHRYNTVRRHSSLGHRSPNNYEAAPDTHQLRWPQPHRTHVQDSGSGPCETEPSTGQTPSHLMPGLGARRLCLVFLEMGRSSGASMRHRHTSVRHLCTGYGHCSVGISSQK
ncbi:integrase core domain-containing protein [Streptomyces klenkii]|uniref:integrase core domain-containing protein n=1 Tax=Streptomyces klenkii TaxID=1420899 RepID=UPI003F4C6661